MSSENKPDKTYPAREVVLPDHEVVIRGLSVEEWDPLSGKCSPGIFQRPDTSVTRIDTVGLETAIQLVKADVEKPERPELNVSGVGAINVGKIKEIGQQPVPAKPAPELHHFQVWEEPTKKNAHHAEVVAYQEAAYINPRKKVALSYSKQLSKAVHIYSVDSLGRITGDSPPTEGDERF